MAKSAVVCDNSRKAVEIIKLNIQKTHFEDYIEVINKDYKKCLDEKKDKKFDIIFLDPPYKANFGIEAIQIIMENDMLKEDGVIIFETDRKEDEYIGKIQKFAKVIDLRNYGRVKLIFLGRKE